MYSASKHAVRVLSQSTSNELMRENSKIRVTVSIRRKNVQAEFHLKILILLYRIYNFQNISPGTIYTEMFLKGMVKMQGIPYDPTLLEGPLPEHSLDPKDVADSVLYILSTPPRVQVIKIKKSKHIYYFNICIIILIKTSTVGL